MSVIINDFEIIPDSAEESGDEEERAGSAPATLEPMDVIDVIEREKRRRRRRRAH